MAPDGQDTVDQKQEEMVRRDHLAAAQGCRTRLKLTHPVSASMDEGLGFRVDPQPNTSFDKWRRTDSGSGDCGRQDSNSP